MKLNQLASVIQWIDEQDEERFIDETFGEFENGLYKDILLEECLDKLNFEFENEEEENLLFKALMQDEDVQMSFEDLDERVNELVMEKNNEYDGGVPDWKLEQM